MNKAQLVEAIAKDTGFTKIDTVRTVDALLAAVQKSLKNGDDVSLTGFGKFSVAKRRARKGVNPATGEAIRIRASKAPKFTAGATLRAAVAGRRKERTGRGPAAGPTRPS